MAAVAASVVSAVLGSAALQATAPRTLSVARFNGLRPCPVPRQRATVFRPVTPRRLTVTAAADAGTLATVQKLIAKQLAISTAQPGFGQV